MSGKITGYNFNFGDLDFDLSHDEAMEIYDYLCSNKIFGVDTVHRKSEKIDIYTKFIYPNKEDRGIELSIVELKELFYLLKRLFKDM